MNDDETAIHAGIVRWAAAVHSGDLATVVADRADDIVMLDVPPPHEGVRGIDAYRAAWPGFFSWQAAGGSFEIVEAHVTAGADVAFAWILLRCDTPEGRTVRPEKRLRVTLGLRKSGDRWTVHHEHHSFPLDAG
ncbi:YybH family protein [Patulibacter americanus]|uniref:YybH family protein n=1 Tax=Patulibacter americanus TaxID=588672 RepID=UPI0003B53F73|nr:SgcJ/EcaC family oxidoreductase [Patulibacter americanus]